MVSVDRLTSRLIAATCGSLAALSLMGITPVAAQLSGELDPTALEDNSTTDTQDDAVKDPFEGFNRNMFAIHIFLDDNVLVPAAKGYRATTPKIARRGISKFLANLRSPTTFINDVLQGEFGRAGNTASRFVINSTIGVGGFADPASRLGIEGHAEDFGQTLAVWGVPSGPYTFIPLFGPGTTRSNVGTIGNFAMNPLLYIRTRPARLASISRGGMTALSVREPLIEPLEDIRANSLDYYASFRSFYLQARAREIANGRTSFEDLPDIGEFEDFDEDEDLN